MADTDIVIIFDSSNSIGEKAWWKAKQLVIDLQKSLPENVRFSIVTFSAKAQIDLDFQGKLFMGNKNV